MPPLSQSAAPASTSSDWRIHKKRTLACLILCVIVLAALGYLERQEQARKDYQRFHQALLALGEAQHAIGEQLKGNPHAEIAASVADLIPAEFPVPVSYKSVSRDGAITVVSHRTGMVLVLQPRIEADNRVTWSCFGSSIFGERRIPPDCRELQKDKDRRET
ncbi:MAG: hypothetical protein LBC37_03825 [Zoogloeaceae bacterium]|jgi:hypothetical protein|nr:hypothetical protein [Zoogloeaceae bacterium]